MSVKEDAIKVADQWYSRLDLYKDKLPSRGSISAALVVLKRLRDKYDPRISAHIAKGQAQIKGLSDVSLAAVLAEFGETRQLTKIAGRTNRGGPGDVAKLLDLMKPLGLGNESASSRFDILTAMMRHIVVNQVSLFFKVQRVKASFNPSLATSHFIARILQNADKSGKAGSVAEHLVGAKLAITFPEKQIRNKSASTADVQLGEEADFEIGDTTFHVTTRPLLPLYDKMKENLANGKRVYLLVLEAFVASARENAELMTQNQVAVESIESFVATNIDEIAEFASGEVRKGLRLLLNTYNSRVDAVEADKSLLIEIPPNLH